MTEKLRFVPPNDGPWELDASHFDRPLARYGMDLFIEGFERGQAGYFERVGMPLKGIKIALVEGLPYGQAVPLVGKPKDTLRPPPPRWVLRLFTALVPAMRRRAANAKRWLESRAWLDEARHWQEEVKPALVARFSALQAEAVGEMSDAELIDHLERCGAAFLDNTVAHFDTNPSTMYPVGAFLRSASAWTGRPPGDLLDLVRSEGGHVPGRDALAALADALRALPEPDRGLNGGRSPEEAIAALRAREDAVGEAARAWLTEVECRQLATGDVAIPIGREVPAMLLDHVREAVSSSGRRATRPAIREDEVRAEVPEAHRAEFDERLADARRVYFVRDERSTLLDNWVGGLLRRSVIEAGRRLAERGALHEPEHVVDLERQEVAALLAGEPGPTADEARDRQASRLAVRIEDAPALLGGDAMPPNPPWDAFGPALGELLSGFMFYADMMDKDAPEPEAATPEVLTGLPASRGRYTGPARIVTSVEAFDAVQPGDVLIARATMPAYNALLPIVGAIVTDKGGALSHAAIVSREYGLPCVVGTRDATTRITDGTIVTVDGDAGVVEIGG